MSKHAVVVGAGVVGLSTAIRIQEAGLKVNIIAEYMPGDLKSIDYTSPWAGAHHVSHAAPDDTRQQGFDRETFKIMWEMSAPDQPTENCFMRVEQTEFYAEKQIGENPLSVMPNFRTLLESELMAQSVDGVQFTTVNIDTPVYLQYLKKRFADNGGEIKRAKLSHIDEAAAGVHTVKPDVIVICAGLGARSLGGIDDQDMYPIRGQIVLIRAPWIKFGRTRSTVDGVWTYVIARRSGDVILGGTKVDNDWYSGVRQETTRDIIERTLAICPELVPPEKRTTGTGTTTPSVADVVPIIIEEGCGLRPARKGGIRLKRETFKSNDGVEVPIVYNYGHGGAGYQSSWGTARIAAELVQEAINGVPDVSVV